MGFQAEHSGRSFLARHTLFGREAPLLFRASTADYSLDRCHLSADQRWMVFRAAVTVAPFRLTPPAADKEWIPILEGAGNDRPAAAPFPSFTPTAQGAA